MALQLHDPEEIRSLLASRVRQLRLQAGWKQITLALHAGLSLPTLRRFERTGRTSLQNFLRICHALGRLDELAALLTPAPARSLQDLEDQARRRIPQRGRR